MNDERCETDHVVMARYGELFLKSEPVKRHFIRILSDNIHRALEAQGIDHRIESPRGRFLIYGSPPDRIANTVAHIFGVVDAGVYLRTTNDPLSLIMVATARATTVLKPGQSFAVRVKRHLKTGPVSQELAAMMGEDILRKVPGVRVNLTNPDYELLVEIRERGGYVGDHRIAGPGGLPFATQGKVICLLSSGIDSPVAAWLMMKRGCIVEALFVDGGRWSGADVAPAAMENLRRLSRWCPGHPIHMHVISSEGLFEAMQGQLKPSRLCCVICKRFMIRAGSTLAERRGALALVTGDNLGQVASQTLHNLATISCAATVPILRPLITYDKEEIISLGRRIGTFSGQQGDLACLAVPTRPSTNAILADVQSLEEQVNIQAHLTRAMEKARSVTALNGLVKGEEVS